MAHAQRSRVRIVREVRIYSESMPDVQRGARASGEAMKVRAGSALILTPQQVARAAEAFRAAVARYESQKALAYALGVSQQAISEACRGTVSLGLAALLAELRGARLLSVIGSRDPDHEAKTDPASVA